MPRPVALLLLLLAAPAVAQPPAKRPLAVADLYRQDAAAEVEPLPDGKSAVYVRAWIDAAANADRRSLWRTAGESRGEPLEPGEPDARGLAVSPDGKWVAFLSTRPRPKGWTPTPPVPPYSDPAVDVWLLPLAGGGPAVPLAGPDKPYGRVFGDPFYGRLAWSPDSKRLAFVADDGNDPRTPAEVRNDVLVVRDDQGEGYTGYRPAQVWLATLADKPGEAAAAGVERLTDDDVWYADPRWSPDGTTLAVVANKTADRESARFSINKNFDLWALDPATRKQTQLTTGPGPEVSPRWSPDGKRLACLSVPRKGPHRDVFNLAVVDLSGPAPAFRVVYDHHAAGADGRPSATFPLADDCWDGAGHVVCGLDAGAQAGTARVDVATGDRADVPAAPPGPDTFAGRRAVRQKFRPPADPLLADVARGTTEAIRWKSFDGREVEGILTLPPAEAGVKPPYPLIVYPHGGPHGRNTVAADFTVQAFAGRGYAVFQPNFRGSTGYGVGFLDADRGDFGGGDMKDILTGCDELIRRGVADRDRQFVFGISYGGFMTSWLVTQTDRFRAAVPVNAVTDLSMMWHLGDLQSWTEWEFGGRPWEAADKLRAHSPLTFAHRVKTPTLVLHSRDDRRCPLPMGVAYYKAVRATGTPAEMVIYPDENHGIRTPRRREDVLTRTLDWFARHDRK